jgi:hypothetical protein
MIRHMLSLTILVVNISIGFHAVLNGNILITLLCAIFGTLCFIDLKEGI